MYRVLLTSLPYCSKNAGPLGGEGKIVEADELYTGHRKGWPVKRGGR